MKIKCKLSSASNWAKEETIEMSSLEDNDGHNCLTNTATLNENKCEDVERGDEISKQNCDDRKGYSFSERRKMPNRASKESSLLGIKRRTIMKPSKHSFLKQEDFNNMKPANIKKIYQNKKLTNFKPSSLETIFEELPSNEGNELSCSRIMSARKIRRIVCFSDGFKYTKAMVNKRRIKIKKTFGKRFALKKISLEEFITKLNRDMDGNEDSSNQNEQLKILEGQTATEIENQSLCPDQYLRETSKSNIANHFTNIPLSTTAAIDLCADMSVADTHFTS